MPYEHSFITVSSLPEEEGNTHKKKHKKLPHKSDFIST